MVSFELEIIRLWGVRFEIHWTRSPSCAGVAALRWGLKVLPQWAFASRAAAATLLLSLSSWHWAQAGFALGSSCGIVPCMSPVPSVLFVNNFSSLPGQTRALVSSRLTFRPFIPPERQKGLCSCQCGLMTSLKTTDDSVVKFTFLVLWLKTRLLNFLQNWTWVANVKFDFHWITGSKMYPK